MPSDLPSLRREYIDAGLSEADLATTWPEQFRSWFGDAGHLREPNAMVLSTADAAGQVSSRTVLLKAFDERGFVFFTNHTSRKGRSLAEHPGASLLFPWIDLERQVVVTGSVQPVSQEETDAYFRSRPRGAQIAAWASRQSSVIASRQVLEQRVAELEQRYERTDVPVPPFWGGLRLVPDSVEFWQGRPSRLHDRLRFRRDGRQWVVERLAP
ncbi:MAG: pyridoxamine 5-phosphate oxidase [Frankiales bacterium]|nr:pyridoxamine 5-phosphate oxidase [Frankiales bacterium]